MNELVFKSGKGTPVTNSLLVAEKFGKDHKNVIQAIENLMAENSAVKKLFYKAEYEVRGRMFPMYIMGRDGFTFLVMGFTGKEANQFKLDYIDAFNQMEQALKTQVAIPQTYAEALELAAKQARELEAKEKEIKQLAPKASYADRVLEADNQKVDIGQAAKLLKLPFGRNTFFEKLREDGIFFKNRNEPKQEYLHYFDLRKEEITRNNHPAFVVLKVLVNPAGLYWLSKKYGGEYNNGIPMIKID